MGTTDKNGIWKYDTSDAINGWPAYMNLGMNSVSNALASLRQNSVPKATSLSDANAKVATLKAQGLTPSTSNPFLFQRTDTKSLWSYDNSTWTELYATSDTGWKDHGGTVQSPFTINHPLQYRVRDGVVYWRGQFHSEPQELGDRSVLINIASEARPTSTQVPLSTFYDLRAKVTVAVTQAGVMQVCGAGSNAWITIGGSYIL